MNKNNEGIVMKSKKTFLVAAFLLAGICLYAQGIVKLDISSAYPLYEDSNDTNAYFISDGNRESYWKSSGGIDLYGVELRLPRQALLAGLRYWGDFSSCGDAYLEAFDGKNWRRLSADRLGNEQGNYVDLTFDHIATGKVRIICQGGEAKVEEAELYGQWSEDRLRKLEPSRVYAKDRGNVFFFEDALTDGNPLSAWGDDDENELVAWLFKNGFNAKGMAELTKHINEWRKKGRDKVWDIKQDEFIFEYESPLQLESIRMYTGKQGKKNILVSRLEGGVWIPTETFYIDGVEGWKTLSCSNIAVGRYLKFSVASSEDRKKDLSIGELELWSSSAAGGDNYLYGRGIGKDPGKSNYSFKGEAYGHGRLEIAVWNGGRATLSIELNGLSDTALLRASFGGLDLYSIDIEEGDLFPEANWLQVVSDAQIAFCRTRKKAKEGRLDLDGGLACDGIMSTSELVGAQRVFDGLGAYLCKEIRLYSEDWGNLRLYAVENGIETELGRRDSFAGCAVYAYEGAVDSLVLKGVGRINELEVYGSQKKPAPLTARLLFPSTRDQWEEDYGFFIGTTDDPDCSLDLGGSKPKRFGRYFIINTSSIKDSAWNAFGLYFALEKGLHKAIKRIKAIKPGLWSWMRIEGFDPLYTLSETLEIRGKISFNEHQYSLRIGGVEASLGRGREFSVTVPLMKGYTRIPVSMVSWRTGQETTIGYIPGARLEPGMKITPAVPDLYYTNQAKLTLTGMVDGVGEPRISINGKPAMINGASVFESLEFNLKEGLNHFKIESSDQMGQRGLRELTVILDTIPPVVIISTPEAGWFLQNPVLTQARMDELYPSVLVTNDLPTKKEGDLYSRYFDFPDGAAKIDSFALDRAGNRSATATVSFVADSTAPETFEIRIEPQDETNSHHPIIRFHTEDLTSGVASYDLSLDLEEYEKVSSPFTIHEPAEGVHGIAVKAFDRAGNFRTSFKQLIIDRTPPAMPHDLVALSGYSKIELRWATSNEDVKNCLIERIPEFSQGTISVQGLSYIDTNVENGKAYQYRVYAEDRAGNISSFSSVTGTAGQKVVDVEEGKDIALAFGEALLMIPEEAIPENVKRFKATSVMSEGLRQAADFEPIGLMYRFTAVTEGVAGETTEEHIAFDQDVLCTIRYDQNQIPPGLSERNIGVFYFDPEYSQWIQLRTSAVDEENDMIVFTTKHLSYYSVQPTPVADLSPQEIRDKGYSPLSSVSKHGELEVSTQGGTARTSKTEFVMHGKEGFRFPIAREYDTGTARENSKRTMLNGFIAFSKLSGLSLDAIYNAYANDWNWLKASLNNTFGETNQARFREAYQQTGDYPYSFGTGWKLALPYMNTTNSGLSVRTLGGGTYFTAAMTKKSETRSGNSRTLVYENHQGEDFTFIVRQQVREIEIHTSLDEYYSLPSYYSLSAKIVSKDGSVVSLNSLGSVVSITDPYETNTIQVAYDTTRKITAISDSVGHTVSFSYAESFGFVPIISKMTSSTDPNASVDDASVSYSYPSIRISASANAEIAFPLLRSAIDAEGREWRYAYKRAILAVPEDEEGLSSAFLKAATEFCDSSELSILPETSQLKGIDESSVTFTLDVASGPGLGIVNLTTSPARFNATSSAFDILAEGAIDGERPKGTSLTRFVTTKVQEYPDAEHNVFSALGLTQLAIASGEELNSILARIKTTSFQYKLRPVGNGQVICDEASIIREKDGTRVQYGFKEQIRKAYGNLMADDTEYVAFEENRSHYTDTTLTTEYRRVSKDYDDYLRVRQEDDIQSFSARTREHFEYDAWSNITLHERLNYAGDSNQPASNRITNTEYVNVGRSVNVGGQNIGAPAFRPSEVRVNHSLPVQFTNTSSSSLIKYGYDASGRLTSETAYDGTKASISTYKYESGLLTGITRSADGVQLAHQSVTTVYDVAGFPGIIEKTLTAEGVEIENGIYADIRTVTRYSKTHGQPMERWNPDQTYERMEYDKIGRVVAITKPKMSTETTEAKIRIDYDDETRSVEVTKAGGSSLRYSYDDLGKTLGVEQSVTNYRGQNSSIRISLSYDKLGNVIGLTDPNNISTSYTYNSLSQLIGIGLPASNTGGPVENASIQYLYAENKKTSTDEKGLTQEAWSDMDGRVYHLRQTGPDGQGGSLALDTYTYYDGLGRPVQVQDPGFNISKTSYDDLGRVRTRYLPPRIVLVGDQGTPQTPEIHYQYDGLGNMKRSEYRCAGEIKATDYRYNSLGWLLATEEHYTDPETGAPASRKTAYVYDHMGRKLREYDANDIATGKTESCLRWEYNSRGKITKAFSRDGKFEEYQYDLDDNLSAVKDKRETPGSARYTVTYEYDQADRIKSITAPTHEDSGETITTYLDYDPRGNSVAIINPDGTTIRRSFSPRGGLETETLTDVIGTAYATTTTQYRSGGLPSKRTQGGTYRVSYEYDALGRETRRIYGDETATKTWYDKLGYLARTEDERGNQSDYSYDAYGTLRAVTDPAQKTTSYLYDYQGKIARATDPLGRDSSYRHDDLGRLLQETQPDGRTSSYAYDLVGNLKEAIDPAGATIVYKMDTAYQLTDVTKNLGSAQGLRSYTYDPAGYLSNTSVDGKSASYQVNAYGQILSAQRDGHNLTINYDSFGKAYAQTLSSGSTVLAQDSYGYDPGGNLKSVTGWVDQINWNLAGQPTGLNYANGVDLSLERDARGRHTNLTWQPSSGQDLSYAYTYDPAGNVSSMNGNSYSYDELNRLTESRDSQIGQTERRLTVASAEGDYQRSKELSIEPEDLEIALDTGGYSIGATFERELTLTSLSLIPGEDEHRVSPEHLEIYLYGAEGAWTKAEAAISVLESGIIKASFTPPVNTQGVKVHCLWDERSLEWAVDTSEATFKNRADSIMRVEYIEPELVKIYAYDAVGNRTGTSIQDSLNGSKLESYAYWTNSDRVKKAGAWAYVYDAVGNLTQKGNTYTENPDGSISFEEDLGSYWSYSYDIWNRLVSVSKGRVGTISAQVVASYEYNAEDLRIKKTTQTATTCYIYDLQGRVIYETRIDTQSSATRTRRFVYALGRLVGYEESRAASTARYWTFSDSLGSITAESDEEGKILTQRGYEDFGQGGAVSAQDDGHEALNWYTGKEYDEDIGLAYFNARWYDAGLGRFTSEDPARDGGNWYAYCAGNPLRYTDPTGLSTQEEADEYLRWLDDTNGGGSSEEENDDTREPVSNQSKTEWRTMTTIDPLTREENILGYLKVENGIQSYYSEMPFIAEELDASIDVDAILARLEARMNEGHGETAIGQEADAVAESGQDETNPWLNTYEAFGVTEGPCWVRAAFSGAERKARKNLTKKDFDDAYKDLSSGDNKLINGGDRDNLSSWSLSSETNEEGLEGFINWALKRLGMTLKARTSSKNNADMSLLNIFIKTNSYTGRHMVEADRNSKFLRDPSGEERGYRHEKGYDIGVFYFQFYTE